MISGWSIRRQLSMLVVGTMLPVAALLAYDIADTWHRSMARAQGQVRDLGSAIADDLETLLRDHEALLARLAERPLVRAMDPRRCDPFVREFASTSLEFPNVGMRDAQGNAVCTLLPAVAPASATVEMRWYREAITSGRFAVGDAQRGSATGRWVSMLAYPVHGRRGAASGMLILPMDLAHVQRKLMRNLPANSIVSVIGRDNKFLMRSLAPDQWIGQDAGTPARTEQARRQGQGLLRAPGVDGVERVYAYRTVAGTGWLVVAGLPEEIVFAPARQRLVQGIVLALAALALSMALAFGISRRIAAPIRAMERTARAAAEGDPAARAPQAGPREIATVARELNRMLDARVAAEAQLRASEERYRLLFEHSLDAVLLTAPDGRILAANPEACRMFGRSEEEICAAGRAGLLDENDPRLAPALRERARSGRFQGELTFLRGDGTRFPGEVSTGVFLDPGGEARTSMVIRDITERKRTQLLLTAEKDVLEMLGSGAALPAILDAIVRNVEALSEDTLASILLLDDDGVHVRHGAAPSLPQAYARAIDGEPIGPRAGSCGTAAYRNEQVIVTDISTDPLWTQYAALALEHGLRACWSTPVRSAAGKVLGTFALYYREVRAPGPADFDLIQRWTHLAGIAIERRQAEERIRRSEQRYRLAASTGDVWSWDIENGVITNVPEFWSRLGVQAPAAADTVAFFESLAHPDDAGRWRQALQDHIRRHVPYDLEFRLRAKSGEYRWFHTKGQAVWNEAGRATYMAGTTFDITGRKRIEEQLAQSETRYRALFENMSAGFVLFEVVQDDRGVPVDLLIVAANAGFERTTGLKKPEAVGKRLRQVLPGIENDAADWIGTYGHVALTGEPRQFEQGSELLGVYYSVVAYRSGPGQCAVTFVDITERKQAEKRVRDYAERLQAVSSKLIDAQEAERAAIARELHDEAGQGLTAMLLNLRAAEGKIRDDAAALAVRRSIEIADAVFKRIHDLSFDLRPPQLDLIGLEATLRAHLQERAAGASLKFSFDSKLGTGARSPQIDIACFRILQEALTNVIRHAQAREVRVEAEQGDDELRLRIRDDGIGFDASPARLLASGRIGLLGMQERVELLGGAFEIRSGSGAGTEIRVRIPLAVDRAVEPARAKDGK